MVRIKDEENSNTILKEWIDNNPDYYLREFKKVSRGEKTNFNWAVFWGGPIIPLYRKCFDLFRKRYLPFILAFIAVTTIQAILNKVANDSLSLKIVFFVLALCTCLWGLIMNIVTAKDFNSYYYDRLKTLSNLHNVKAKGGTSHTYYLIYAVCMVAFAICLRLNAGFGVVTNSSMGMTKEQLVRSIDECLSQNAFEALENAEFKETKAAFADGGFLLCSEYTMVNGIKFYFFEDVNTGKLRQFTFYADKSKLKPKDTMLLGLLNRSFVYIFEPEEQEAYRLKVILNMTNNSDKKFYTSATTKLRKYHFIKEDHLIYLYVFPKGKKYISLDQLDFNSTK